MSLQKFTLASLSTIDEGRIAVAFEQALMRCEHDLRDRPAVGATRKVTLQVALVPRMDDDGQLLEVLIQADVKDSLPKRSTKVYHANAARSGLFFNELSPEDARQLTIDSAMGPKPTTSEDRPQPQPERKDVHVG